MARLDSLCSEESDDTPQCDGDQERWAKLFE